MIKVRKATRIDRAASLGIVNQGSSSYSGHLGAAFDWVHSIFPGPQMIRASCQFVFRQME